MGILPVHLFVIYMPGSQGGQKGASDPLNNRVTDGCESPCGCWESKPGLLEVQPVLLNAEPHANAQTHFDWFLYQKEEEKEEEEGGKKQIQIFSVYISDCFIIAELQII